MMKALHEILHKLGGEKRMDFGLERFRKALKQLGNPQDHAPAIVIGGTNGKGSTTLLISTVLKESGFRVATYLSPHLQSPSERLLMDLVPANEEDMARLALEHERLAHEHKLTYFEFLTLLYFLWAKEHKADLQVVEVGLGGRLDATNVTDPIACAITNIALDHQQYLGNTHAQILEEKLGILPEEGLLFTGISEPELLAIVEKRCAERDAIYYYSKELSIEPGEISWEGQSFKLNGYPFFLPNPLSAMRMNAALAFLLLRIVFPKIPVSRIQAAFRKSVNPGRFELVSQNPRVILSGDHNPHGLAALSETIKALGPGNLKILCGFSPDKPYTEMYQRLKELSPEILLTRAGTFKGEPGEDYTRLGPYAPNPQQALEKILSQTGPEDVLLVTGSLYLVGELRSRWRPKVEFLKEP